MVQKFVAIHFYLTLEFYYKKVELLRDFLIIKDPEVAKLFADPCRRSILHNLRKGEMTPYQLAKALGKNVSSISHHLKALEKAGLVEQSRRVVRGNLIEKFYTAKAKMFIISYTLTEGLVPGSEDIAKWSKEIYKRAISGLEAFGYKVSEEKMNEFLKLIERYASFQKMTYEEIVNMQKFPSRLHHHELKLVLSLLAHVHLYNNSEFLEVLKELSDELNKIEKKELFRG